jgi:hypothetical protein
VATYHARTDQRATCVASTAAPTIFSRTDAATPMVVLAPMPTVVLGFNGATPVSFGLHRPMFQPPPMLPEPAPSTADDLEDTAEEPMPESELELAATAETGSEDSDEALPEAELPGDHANRIELIIDSLPNHMLIESIPVTITPMGNEVFTAAVRDVNLSASGSGVGESLLVLKEQIEFLYDDLRQKLHLSTEQKQLLKMLQTYIAQPPVKPGWA